MSSHNLMGPHIAMSLCFCVSTSHLKGISMARHDCASIVDSRSVRCCMDSLNAKYRMELGHQNMLWKRCNHIGARDSSIRTL